MVAIEEYRAITGNQIKFDQLITGRHACYKAGRTVPEGIWLRFPQSQNLRKQQAIAHYIDHQIATWRQHQQHDYIVINLKIFDEG